jgi:hypothetical protein
MSPRHGQSPNRLHPNDIAMPSRAVAATAAPTIGLASLARINDDIASTNQPNPCRSTSGSTIAVSRPPISPPTTATAVTRPAELLAFYVPVVIWGAYLALTTWYMLKELKRSPDQALVSTSAAAESADAS